MIHGLRITWALLLLLEIPDCAFQCSVILDKGGIMGLEEDRESESKENTVKIVK
jgi:hypothetical protein